jgi:hypothetical protein
MQRDQHWLSHSSLLVQPSLYEGSFRGQLVGNTLARLSGSRKSIRTVRFGRCLPSTGFKRALAYRLGYRCVVKVIFGTVSIGHGTGKVFMKWIIWIAGSVLFLLFIWIASLNVMAFWRTLIRQDKTPSWIPVIGGLCGCIAILIFPVSFVRPLWWLPVLLDWGSLPGLSYTVYCYLRRSTVPNKR